MTNGSESGWASRSCRPCRGDTPLIPAEQADRDLVLLPGWKRDGQEIVRTFSFKNYDQTVAFVNAVAGVARREDHHPEMTFGYNKCTVRYTTHAIKGLSENDFICAAKISALFGAV